MSISEMKRREIARILGMLFQDTQDYFPSTVLETALIGRHPHIGKWQDENPHDENLAREFISAVGLSGMEGRLIETLSGGERRRLALATLLVQDPEICLLDEPTNHLDIGHQIGMLDLLEGLCKRSGKSVVMALHDPNLAERYCDKILLLFDGGKAVSGEKKAILDGSSLTRLYGHPIHSVEGPEGRLFFPITRSLHRD